MTDVKLDADLQAQAAAEAAQSENENISPAQDCEYKEYKQDHLHRSLWFRALRAVLYALIRIIFPPALRLIYGFKIKGRENFAGVKGGAVLVYNHVHCLDCIMAALAVPKPYLYYVTIQENCDIPFVGELITVLGAWPLPQKAQGFRAYKRRLSQALRENNWVVVCPEGSRESIYGTLRPFKNGAFAFASENDVPILPCVIKKVKRGRRTALEFEILPPIYADKNLKRKQQVEALCDKTRADMLAAISEDINYKETAKA